MNFKHESAYRIFVGIPIPLIILFIPVAVRLLTSPSYFFALSVTAAAELILIIFFITRGIILWRCSGFGIQRSQLLIKRGFLNRSLLRVKPGAVTSFELTRSVFNAVFGISRLEIYTPGGIADSVYLSAKQTEQFKKLMKFESLSDTGKEYKLSIARTVAMSVTGSNSIAGLFIIIPVVRTAVIDIFDALSKTAMGILPFRSKILTALTAIWIFGWFISSADKMIRFYHFKIRQSENHIFMSGGLFFRYIRQLDVKKIYAVDIRETLLSMILGLSSVYLTVPGCRKQRSRKLAFLPSANLRELNRMMRSFFPYSEEVICTLSTPKKYRLNHFAAAFNTLWITVLLGLRLGDAAFPVAAMISVLCLWDMSISFFAVRRNGLKICPDCVIICGKRFFTLHTQKISREKIDAVTITRNPFERLSGLCSVKIKIKGVQIPAKCRHVPFERAVFATARL